MVPGGSDSNLRFCTAKVARFGAVNEAKKSTKYFSERVNGGAEQSGAIPCPNLYNKIETSFCASLYFVATLSFWFESCSGF